jgi:predicted transcriptional regulator
MIKPKSKSKPEPKTVPFSIRLIPAVREALEKVGKAEDRPASYIALRAIVDYLRAYGALK